MMPDDNFLFTLRANKNKSGVNRAVVPNFLREDGGDSFFLSAEVAIKVRGIIGHFLDARKSQFFDAFLDKRDMSGNTDFLVSLFYRSAFTQIFELVNQLDILFLELNNGSLKKDDVVFKLRDYFLRFGISEYEIPKSCHISQDFCKEFLHFIGASDCNDCQDTTQAETSDEVKK